MRTESETIQEATDYRHVEIIGASLTPCHQFSVTTDDLFAQPFDAAEITIRMYLRRAEEAEAKLREQAVRHREDNEQYRAGFERELNAEIDKRTRARSRPSIRECLEVLRESIPCDCDLSFMGGGGSDIVRTDSMGRDTSMDLEQAVLWLNSVNKDSDSPTDYASDPYVVTDRCDDDLC